MLFGGSFSFQGWKQLEELERKQQKVQEEFGGQGWSQPSVLQTPFS